MKELVIDLLKKIDYKVVVLSLITSIGLVIYMFLNHNVIIVKYFLQENEINSTLIIVLVLILTLILSVVFNFMKKILIYSNVKLKNKVIIYKINHSDNKTKLLFKQALKFQNDELSSSVITIEDEENMKKWIKLGYIIEVDNARTFSSDPMVHYYLFQPYKTKVKLEPEFYIKLKTFYEKDKLNFNPHIKQEHDDFYTKNRRKNKWKTIKFHKE